MNIEGLYSVQFQGAAGAGGGVLVLQDGKAYGGDSWMFYVGHYEASGSSIRAHVTVHQHRPGSQSIFGTMFDAGRSEFSVQLTGQISGNGMDVAGGVDGAPQYQLSARLERLSDTL